MSKKHPKLDELYPDLAQSRQFAYDAIRMSFRSSAVADLWLKMAPTIEKEPVERVIAALLLTLIPTMGDVDAEGRELAAAAVWHGMTREGKGCVEMLLERLGVDIVRTDGAAH